jgi:mannose-6-phosphate isomerase-like protein (cupin superfamily)
VSVPSNKFGSKLMISKLDESSFSTSGRREFVAYRDLGIREATNGNVGAIVTRLKEGSGEPTGWHYHTCDLQIFYILKGWLELDCQDAGLVRLEAGTCVNIPPGVAHNELRVSPDLEVLEITMPGELGTVPVAAPAQRD